MKKMTKVLALGLSAVMVLGMAACSSSSSAAPETQAPATSAPETDAPETDAPETEATSGGATEDTPLVVGYSNFSEKFSPFFSETAYDQDVYAMTQIGLLNSDRQGAIIYKGIEGETINYNGTDYTYYGPADCVVTENADGSVYYDFTLRDDIVFSDGEPVTIDDVIFTMYVLCDPTYAGTSAFSSLPIEGLADYRAGMDTLLNLLFDAGRAYTDFTYWTKADQTAFWQKYDACTLGLAEDIVARLKAAGIRAKGDFSDNSAGWKFAQ